MPAHQKKHPMHKTTSLTKYKKEFTIALYQDEGMWVAHNLDLDIVACDKDQKKAISELRDLTLGHIEFCIVNNCIEQLIHPAPERFWKLVTEKVTAEVINQIIEKKFSAEELIENSPIYQIKNPVNFGAQRQAS